MESNGIIPPQTFARFSIHQSSGSDCICLLFIHIHRLLNHKRWHQNKKRLTKNSAIHCSAALHLLAVMSIRKSDCCIYSIHRPPTSIYQLSTAIGVSGFRIILNPKDIWISETVELKGTNNKGGAVDLFRVTVIVLELCPMATLVHPLYRGSRVARAESHKADSSRDCRTAIHLSLHPSVLEQHLWPSSVAINY